MMGQQGRQEYEQRMEWERQEKQDRFRVAAKMMEFMGVVLGVICIFLLLGLLVSLISWLDQDISQFLNDLTRQIQ